jgi:hypothetical protein
MKYDNFKKCVLRESAVFAAGLAGIIVVLYLLGMVGDDYAEDNSKLQGQVNGVDGEMNVLRAKYANILQNVDLYREVQRKQEVGELAITRQAIMDKFNLFKERYLLTSLRLSMAAVTELKDPLYRRKSQFVNSSEVNIDIETLSDEDVYDLWVAMQKDLPGLCRIVKLSMIKEKELTPDVLAAIGQKGTYPLVKTQMKFIWFGINPVESADDASKKPH